MNEEISHSEIIELTLKQESLILFDRDKWQKIAYSTESIDRTKVADTIENAYKFIGKPIPKIIFCHSPGDALKRLGTLPIKGDIVEEVEEQFETVIFKELEEKLIDSQKYLYFCQ
ncbi:MAG: hypothetical protein ACRC2R_02345 [Xenococcaceae cyanobacterium]